MWPLPKKTTQVGGRFLPCVTTLHHSRLWSFMCLFALWSPTPRPGWGVPACWDGELGCFWVFRLAGVLAGNQILDIKRWPAGKIKSSPPPQRQDLLPNSASILLCGSGRVLRAGCAMCMRETRGHQLLKSRGIGASQHHQHAKKLWPLRGSDPPSTQENSDIVPLHGRITGLNSCVTNFNNRGGRSKLKALLSAERAGRQHFNENHKQPLCA